MPTAAGPASNPSDSLRLRLTGGHTPARAAAREEPSPSVVIGARGL